MAIKNNDNLSEFGKRLLALMAEKECDSPKDLAIQLLDAKLVKVDYRGKDISKKRDNAIGSVVKKIRVHLHAEDATCLQGEFVHAYCQFFSCSADYLFGYTPIRTADIQIRQICERTGLSELVVCRLIDDLEKGRNHYPQGWSHMMESGLYYGVIDNWQQAAEQSFLAIQKDIEKTRLLKELETAEGPDKMDLALDLEGVEKEVTAANAAYAGLLFNISRNVANYIELAVKPKAEEFRKRYASAWL